MGKGKLAKFADMAENPLVVECPFWKLQNEGFALKGKWHSDFFHNDNPIVLELGCGHGLPGMAALLGGADIVHFCDFVCSIFVSLFISL